MAKKKIYVSPSSQTENKYIVGDTNEAVQCRKIAAFLVPALIRCGFEALTNTTGNMYDRTAESNRWGADLHLPIHTNAYNKKVRGTRIYCHDTKGEGYKAAKAIMATLKPITPGTSDSINARDNLYEINKAKAPVAYIEVAFHDNEEEAAWIIANTEAIGSGTQPVYFTADGVPAATTYALNKTVPADAVFTDTTYSAATQSADGLMSSTDKTKLDGIATGAEVNQNAFSSITVGSSTVAADAKTDSFSLVEGSNVTLSVSNDAITIAATDTTYDEATTSAAGLMSATDKEKLDGIEASADVNVLEGVQVNGTDLTITNKKVNITVATGDTTTGNIKVNGVNVNIQQ